MSSKPKLLKPVKKKDDGIARYAYISSDGKYRYVLTRIWKYGKPIMLWVMLNPSTADGTVDDNTVKKCMAFAKAAGYGGIQIVNLFALRATDPRELLKANDPVGPVNNSIIAGALKTATTVMVAWGSHKMTIPESKKLFNMYGDILWCLGVNKDGHPKHPLYIDGSTKPVPWNPPDDWGL